jgi:hypothetical protein
MGAYCQALTSAPMSAAEFIQHVTKHQGGCWTWNRARIGKDGYGVCRGKGAHRVSYVLFKGPIPRGQLVRHKCDNPPCVNPDHLELGTARENAIDASVRRKLPSLAFRVRTADGATIQRKGSCTDRQGFAVYLIGLLGDHPAGDSNLKTAYLAFLDECEKALAEKRNGRPR